MTDIPALIARVRELQAKANPPQAPGYVRVGEANLTEWAAVIDEIPALATALEAALAENERLREALKPFAERAADYDRPADDPGYPIEPDYRPKEQRTRRLLIGDLRAARAVLEETR